jgi:tetratricopeptide (TPR) repeat protein
LGLAEPDPVPRDPQREGDAAFQKQDYDRAITDYTEAIRLACFSRGRAFHNKGEFVKALADFTEAIRLDPKEGSSFYNRGVTYQALGEFEKAIADFTQAIRRDPQLMYAYNNRANLLEKQGAYDKAIADYREAIRLDPKNATPLMNLGWLLATCSKAEIRDGRKALEYAYKACELTNWNDPWCLDTLAAAQAEVGEFKEAARRAKEALELMEKSPRTKREEVEARLQQYEQGKPYHEK